MYEMLRSRGIPIEERQLLPYSFPDENSLKEIGYLSVPLGSFIPWNYQANSELIKKELAWEVDELEGVPISLNSHGEKIECFMQGTRDYIKFLKRGYGRSMQISAFKARSGEISQPEAVANSLENDGKIPPSLDLFLNYVGLSIEEFHEIVEESVITPWTVEKWPTETSKQLDDFDQWFRE
jgi:hypothetical protein